MLLIFCSISLLSRIELFTETALLVTGASKQHVSGSIEQQESNAEEALSQETLYTVKVSSD
jgi:hypothetical protein